jgi:hypothetical protein
MASTPTEQHDIFAALRARAVSALADLLPDLPPEAFARVQMEPPRDPAHGDMATNAAMVVAKAARQPPPKLAAALAERLSALPEVAEAAPAGPASSTSASAKASSAPSSPWSSPRASGTATAPPARVAAWTWSTSPPTPPAPCTSAIAAAPWSATR